MLACEWLSIECRDSRGNEANNVFSNRFGLSLSSSWPYLMTHYNLYGIMFQVYNHATELSLLWTRKNGPCY